MSFTPTVPSRSPHTAALLEALQTRCPVLIGDGSKPTDVGWQGAPGVSEFICYGVLYPIDGGQLDGSLGDPSADLSLPWQVTVVGRTRRQCEDAADAVRVALLSVPITVPGRGGCRIYVDTPGGTRPDETVDPAVFISTERYRFATNA